jgi:CS domain
MVESQNALQESIKTRGDKSYYYAHAPRNVDDPSLAKVLEGEGIVTGGDPKLLVKDVPRQEPVRRVTNIKNYAWHDDDDKVVISVPFDDTQDKIKISFGTDDLELIYEVSELETRKLIIKSLNKNIVPDSCSYKIRKGKLNITLVKEDTDQTWYQLTKS